MLPVIAITAPILAILSDDEDGDDLQALFERARLTGDSGILLDALNREQVLELTKILVKRASESRSLDELEEAINLWYWTFQGSSFRDHVGTLRELGFNGKPLEFFWTHGGAVEAYVKVAENEKISKFDKDMRDNPGWPAVVWNQAIVGVPRVEILLSWDDDRMLVEVWSGDWSGDEGYRTKIVQFDEVDAISQRRLFKAIAARAKKIREEDDLLLKQLGVEERP